MKLSWTKTKLDVSVLLIINILYYGWTTLYYSFWQERKNILLLTSLTFAVSIFLYIKVIDINRLNFAPNLL